MKAVRNWWPHPPLPPILLLPRELWETLAEPCLQARARHTREKPYLEGLELALHLLTEALAVLAKLPLLGGLGSRILKPSFQLRKKADLLFIKQNLPRGHCGTDPGSLCTDFLYQIHHELKAKQYLNWNGHDH